MEERMAINYSSQIERIGKGKSDTQVSKYAHNSFGTLTMMMSLQWGVLNAVPTHN